MLLKKNQIPIFVFVLIYLIIYSIIFLSRRNYEFVSYVGVIVLFFFFILFTNKKVNYPNIVLLGLGIWGFLHMSGGGITFHNGSMRLYEVILISISESYQIFKYDQFVHIFGFGVATLVMFVLLKPFLRFPIKRWSSISILIIMAGLGVGAFNEIVEFIVTVLVPETGVGGYVNTSLDLVSDLIGAILAMAYIQLKKGEI